MPAPHHSYIHKTNTTHLLSTARNSPRLSKRSESVLDALIFLASSCSRSRRDRRRPDDSFSASRGASLSSATASPRDHLNNKHRQTHLHLLLFWHAPPGVCSAIRTHQPPQRTVLGQVDCFVQCEVVGSQIALDGVQPCDTRTPWWSLPAIWWGAVRIISTKVTIDLQQASYLRNILPRTQSFSEVRFTCKIVKSSEILSAN